MFRQLPYADFLMGKGVLTREQLDRLEQLELETGTYPEVLLVEKRFIPKQKLLALKSEFYRCGTVDLKNIKLDNLTVRLIPRSMCERYKVLCLKLVGTEIQGLMVNPLDKFAIEYIKIRTGYTFIPHVGYWGDMEKAIQMAFAIPDARSYRAAEAGSTQSLWGAPLKDSLEKKVAEHHEGQESQEREIHRTLSTLRNDWEIQRLINQVSMNLGSYLDRRTLIPKILELSRQIFNVEGVSLILKQGDQPYLFFENVLGGKETEIEHIMIPLDEKSVAGWIAINERPLLINDVSRDFRHSKIVDQASNFTTRSILGVPVKYGNEVLGVLEAVNKKNGEFSSTEIEHMQILASHAALALKNAEIYDRLKNFTVEAVELLIDFLDYIEVELKGHMVEVARIATSIGEQMGFKEEELENLCHASLLHDIGIVKLKEGEFEEHPIYGAEILQHIKLFEGLIPYVLHHHERHDGSGFPHGLSGDEIPLGAQIVGLAEAYVEGLHTAKTANTEEYLRAFLKFFEPGFNPMLKEPFKRSITEGIDLQMQ